MQKMKMKNCLWYVQFFTKKKEQEKKKSHFLEYIRFVSEKKKNFQNVNLIYEFFFSFILCLFDGYEIFFIFSFFFPFFRIIKKKRGLLYHDTTPKPS